MFTNFWMGVSLGQSRIRPTYPSILQINFSHVPFYLRKKSLGLFTEFQVGKIFRTLRRHFESSQSSDSHARLHNGFIPKIHSMISNVAHCSETFHRDISKGALTGETESSPRQKLDEKKRRREKESQEDVRKVLFLWLRASGQESSKNELRKHVKWKGCVLL